MSISEWKHKVSSDPYAVVQILTARFKITTALISIGPAICRLPKKGSARPSCGVWNVAKVVAPGDKLSILAR